MWNYLNFIVIYFACLQLATSFVQTKSNSSQFKRGYIGPGCSKIKFINVDNSCPEVGKFAIAGDCTKYFDCIEDDDGKISPHTSYCPRGFNFNGNDCIPDKNQLECYQTDCIANTNSSEEESTEQRELHFTKLNATTIGMTSENQTNLIQSSTDASIIDEDEMDTEARAQNMTHDQNKLSSVIKIFEKVENETDVDNLPSRILKIEVIPNDGMESNHTTATATTAVLTAKSGPLNVSVSEGSSISNVNVSMVQWFNGKVLKVTVNGTNQELKNTSQMATLSHNTNITNAQDEDKSQPTETTMREPVHGRNLTWRNSSSRKSSSQANTNHTRTNQWTNINSTKRHDENDEIPFPSNDTFNFNDTDSKAMDMENSNVISHSIANMTMSTTTRPQAMHNTTNLTNSKMDDEDTQTKALTNSSSCGTFKKARLDMEMPVSDASQENPQGNGQMIMTSTGPSHSSPAIFFYSFPAFIVTLSILHRFYF